MHLSPRCSLRVPLYSASMASLGEWRKVGASGGRDRASGGRPRPWAAWPLLGHRSIHPSSTTRPMGPGAHRSESTRSQPSTHDRGGCIHRVRMPAPTVAVDAPTASQEARNAKRSRSIITLSSPSMPNGSGEATQWFSGACCPFARAFFSLSPVDSDAHFTLLGWGPPSHLHPHDPWLIGGYGRC